MSEQVEIFTDGACRGNPGMGGWAALLRYQGQEKQISGAESMTTNNRMELQAAISALQLLSRRCQVALTTDSQYVRQGITQWIHRWKSNGWRTSSKQPVKNMDLWQQLDELTKQHDVHWHWIKGHSGHPENEQVDQLANQAIDQLLTEKQTTA